MSDKIDKMIEERGAIYGDFKKGNDVIGAAWGAILARQFNMPTVGFIPGNIVALMMAIVKVIRATGNLYHEDNYIDAQVYIELAKRSHPGYKEERNEGSTT